MSHTLVSLACHAYAAAAFFYLAFLVRPYAPMAIVGRVLVGGGLLLHGAGLGSSLMAQGGAPVGLGQGFSVLAFLLTAIFFGLELRYRRAVIGAFLTPVAVALLVPGLLIADSPISQVVRQPLLPVHVATALLGVAASAVAAAVAVMYLAMERQMKAKRFGLLYARLPSLEFLDGLSRQLVLGGFIALSVTLVTGSFFAMALGGWQWDPKTIATMGAWVVFAAILSSRLFSGWHGKRAAQLTMAGFALLLVSFLTSFRVGV